MVRLDLVAHFQTDETGISFGERTACLKGETLDGTPLSGCDDVRTVPDKDGDGLLDEQEVNLGTHDLNPDSARSHHDSGRCISW